MVPFRKGKLWLGGQKDIARAQVVSSAGPRICCGREPGTPGTLG